MTQTNKKWYGVIDATLPEHIEPASYSYYPRTGEKRPADKVAKGRAEQVGQQYHPVIYVTTDLDAAIGVAEESENRWVVDDRAGRLQVGLRIPRSNASNAVVWRRGNDLTAIGKARKV